MQKIIILCLILFTLSGCVRKLAIEQGNNLTPDKVSQLHRGMTPAEVKTIMGTPVLLNTFNDNRMDYIYTFQPGGKPMTEKRLTLIFQNNKLYEIKE